MVIEGEWLQKILFGHAAPPKFCPNFPAKKITTQMNWKDVVLSNYTQNQIDDILIWLKHNESLLKDDVPGRKTKPGYRVLFHGPPGTGKTLTATLLGKQFEKDVYRIDLSQVVSKYIGETKKTLKKFLQKQNIKTGSYFLMKPMHCLASAPVCRTRMTGMQTRYFLTCCSAFKIFRGC